MAEVPLWVVTVTSTVPAAWAGAKARMELSERTVKSVGSGATLPKLTAVAPVKLLPKMAMVLAPTAYLTCRTGQSRSERGGVVGDLVCERSGKCPQDPPRLTSSVPAELGGAVVVMVVALTMVKKAAATLPKKTPVASVKLTPVRVTGVVPAVEAVAVLNPETRGARPYHRQLAIAVSWHRAG